MIYKDVDSFLNANSDDVICYCVGTGGCKSLILNLIKSSNAVGLPVVLFALDSIIAGALNGKCDVVMHRSDRVINPSKFYRYNTKDYINVAYQRFPIGDSLISNGRTMVYMDVDIVVKEDFRIDILQLHKKTKADCLSQENASGKCCLGFVSMKPTENSCGLLTQDFLDSSDYLSFSKNQDWFNSKVLSKKLLSVDFLDKDKYPNGSHYYKHSKRIDPVCKIIHFNCMVGKKAKIKKMKRHGYWE